MTKRTANAKLNNSVTYLEYIDASYTFKRISAVPSDTNHVLGRIFISNDKYIGISFRDNGRQPIEGLLIPRSALVKVKKFKKYSNILKKAKSGTAITVNWDDIAHFDNGQVPKHLSTAYSEGYFFDLKSETLIIDKPETLIFCENQEPRNHPVKKASRYFIPLRLITGITLHEK